jgi:HD superfamily phosphodiesterase
MKVLLDALEEYFGDDVKRINHAKRVMRFAEELLEKEKADRDIVIPASILHDIGIKVAEQKYGSAAARYQEKEGPSVARKILFKCGFGKEAIDEICGIIGHHHSPGKINTLNFKVLYDADWLVNLGEEFKAKERGQLKTIIDRIFLTKAGEELAKKIYLDEK